jgi:hypothetical protein
VFKISQLDDRTVEEMCRVLNTPFASSAEGARKSAVNALASLSDANRKDFSKIAESLIALYGVKAAADVSLQEFVGDIADAMESLEDDPDWRVPEEQNASFRERLVKLLSAEAFTLVSKAQDLQTDDERTFCRARILTDLRPVFGSNVEDGPKGMVLVHLLKLGFHEASSERRHEEFYISLDAEDLQTLKKVIERAETKARVLRSAVPNLPVLGVIKD